MKLEYEDAFEPEDFHTINSRERFDHQLSVDDVRLTTDIPLVVRYDYVDLGATDYHFQQQFTQEDTKGYFSRMKEFAGKKINALLADSGRLHFYRSELRGKVLEAVRKILPKAIETDQIIYHFSLYDTDRWADRSTDTRNSRVYFILGTYGHIYILFFDPYHELNPMPRPAED
jgi:hypothetical protein